MIGLTFSDEDSLFESILKEWDRIPPETIHNFYESFRARCIVCAQIHGESLNGHWKEVRKQHDLYRTTFE
ncbi:hypothetical protein M9Y10_011874 [Tritrichomonas musculus]|uniref:Uncharacterized protein n=1 Tax=Tritrichomonas musculus TaxID=1915356 RepID=A0ABR2IC67_9EUKA